MDRLNLDVLTTWLDLGGLLLIALGLGALAAGALLGPVVLGIGVWATVTGLAVSAGSALVAWHNDRKRRLAAPRRQPGGVVRG